MNVPETFKEILIHWTLSVEQAAYLIHCDPKALQDWCDQPDSMLVPEGVHELIGLYSKLRTFFNDTVKEKTWLETSHPDFADQSPIQFAGQNLNSLRWLVYFLDTRISKGLNI